MSSTEQEHYAPAFLEHYSSMDDPRQKAKFTYPLDEVFLLVPYVVLFGVDQRVLGVSANRRAPVT